MRGNRFYLFTIIALIVGLGYVCYLVLRPFVMPVAWAAILAIIFFPFYSFLRKLLPFKFGHSIASLITTAIALVLILGPFTYILFLLVTEAGEISGYLERGELQSIQDLSADPKIAWLLEKMKPLFQVEDVDVGRLVMEQAAKFGNTLLGQASKGAMNLVTGMLNFLFMSLALFFFLRDGGRFLDRARDYLPFSHENRERLEKQVKDMVVSTVFGGVIVAIVQGAIGGITLYFLGIGSPVLWGFAMAVMSFVPMFGTFTVWGPMVIYLLINGALWQAIVLLLVGTLVIGLVDNILKPIIIGGRTKMPTLLIFFCVLGGMKLFGIIGLIAGPLAVALLISVLEIFRNVEQEE